MNLGFLDGFTVVDLRQYTLHPGRREELITLFDAHFVDGQRVRVDDRTRLGQVVRAARVDPTAHGLAQLTVRGRPATCMTW